MTALEAHGYGVPEAAAWAECHWENGNVQEFFGISEEDQAQIEQFWEEQKAMYEAGEHQWNDASSEFAEHGETTTMPGTMGATAPTTTTMAR